MKTIITIIFIFYLRVTFCQNIYEVTPGTKGNEISLTVANVSETNSATNVSVTFTKKSSALNFSKETGTIELLEANDRV